MVLIIERGVVTCYYANYGGCGLPLHEDRLEIWIDYWWEFLVASLDEGKQENVDKWAKMNRIPQTLPLQISTNARISIPALLVWAYQRSATSLTYPSFQLKLHLQNPSENVPTHLEVSHPSEITSMCKTNNYKL